MANIFANRAWSNEEKARLTALLDEGDKVLQDVQALKDGLKDTVLSISEDYDIPKRALNKAIRAYHKQNLADDKESMSEVEEILTLTGKTF
jgi:transposase-like protein